MAVVRVLLFLLPFLAVTLNVPAQADSGIDATGQVFLSFEFSGGARSAPPHFGLRLGTQPGPTFTDSSSPDFTSVVALSFDGLSRGELSLGGLRMAVIETEGATDRYHDHPLQGAGTGLGYAASAAPLQSDLRNEPAPLVTAAGPAAAKRQPETKGTVALARPTATDPAAIPAARPSQSRWAFRAVETGAHDLEPGFRRLAASLQGPRLGTMTQARPARATLIAAAANPVATSNAPRWQFKPLGATIAKANAPLVHYAALLLAPHRHGGLLAAVTTIAAQPPASSARLHIGQWIFQNLTGTTTG